MKKFIIRSVVILICCFAFMGQTNHKKNFDYEDGFNKKILGWSVILSSDTEHFAKVFFSNENLGCIYKGYHPVKRTTNGGNTWDYGITPYFYSGIDGSVFFNGNQIFMSGHSFYSSYPFYFSAVLKSSTMGLTWDTVMSMGTTLLHPQYVINSMKNNVGYADIIGYWAGLNYIKTNNGGLNWFPYGDPYPQGYFIGANSISYYDTNEIYGISMNGNNIGKTSGTSNNSAFRIIKTGSFSKICTVDSNNILALSNTFLFRSTDAGNSWDSTVFPVKLFSISFPDQNTGYITGALGKIYKSTNKGTNWISQITSTTDSLVDCCFLNNSTGYVIGSGGILLKTNNGGGAQDFTVSGQVRYSDNNQPATGGYVKAIKLDTLTGLIITYDSVQIQSNGNYTLTHVPQALVDIGVYPNSSTQNDWVMTYYPSTIYWKNAITIYPTGNMTDINIGAIRSVPVTNTNSVNGKVMRVSDLAFGNLKDAVLYAKSGSAFVRCGISDGNGVYHLSSLPAGNLKIICDRMGFWGDSATVNVTTTSNIDSINLFLNFVSVGVQKLGSIVPSEYRLYQNYPNPFNPTTKIKYQISNNKLVLLKVYDLLGREVAELVNEKQAPGVYEISFDAGNLPSGIYFYKLEAGSYIETKKMLLIK